MGLRQRQKSVWDLSDNQYNPDYMNYWKEDFYMLERTFEKLVNLLRASLEKQDTHFRRAIPVKKCVSFALWRLASGNYFRTTSEKNTKRITNVTNFLI